MPININNCAGCGYTPVPLVSSINGWITDGKLSCPKCDHGVDPEYLHTPFSDMVNDWNKRNGKYVLCPECKQAPKVEIERYGRYLVSERIYCTCDGAVKRGFNVMIDCQDPRYCDSWLFFGWSEKVLGKDFYLQEVDGQQ